MPFPVASILSAVTPLVLNALELHRRRTEAQASQPSADDPNVPPAVLRVRLQELEDSDIEQTRLISELSRNVEALARTLDAVISQNRRLQRLLWVVGAIAIASAGISLWLGLR